MQVRILLNPLNKITFHKRDWSTDRSLFACSGGYKMKYFNFTQNKTLGEATDSELWDEINRREQKKIQQRSVGIVYTKEQTSRWRKDQISQAPGVMKKVW